MSEIREKQIGELRVRMDRDICIGSGNCTKVCPQVFELDEDDTVAFTEPIGEAERDEVIEACDVCPVGALFAFDAEGKQIVPS